MVSLSAGGVALVEHLKASRGEWFCQLLQDWEPADAQAFGDYLERFAASFEDSKTTPFTMSNSKAVDASETKPVDASLTKPSGAPKTRRIEVSK
jgi:hypothetical protein